jgi:hypothetical protein
MRHMRVFLLGIGIGLIGIIGCDGGGSGNVVTGKVTFDGKPVAGTITFSGKDKTVTASMDPPDGSYKIEKVAAGLNQITMKKGVTPKDMVAPPQKYATPGNLKFDVQSGRNTKDFTLEP